MYEGILSIFVRKYESTFVPSYESTKVLSKILPYSTSVLPEFVCVYTLGLSCYLRRYFRTKVLSYNSTYVLCMDILDKTSMYGYSLAREDRLHVL
mgnify:CR=1 FL=1